MVRANNLAIESDEILEQDFHYYDEESLAFAVRKILFIFSNLMLILLLNSL